MEMADLAIKYETRILYFKAIHNVIERHMLREGYVRFGRWFTRPLVEQTSAATSAAAADCAPSTSALPAYVMAARLEFDVKSENHVCATIKTQCQPPLLALSPRHLRAAERQAIVLAPWSLRATLMPHQPLRELQNAAATERLNASSTSIGSSSSASHNTSGDDPTIATAAAATLPEEVRHAVQTAWAEWSRLVTLPLDPLSADGDVEGGGDGDNDEAADNDEADEQENRASQQPTDRKRRPPKANAGDDESAANKSTAAAAADGATTKNAQLPKFALVEVDGVRMFWPTCLIAIVAPDPRDATQKDAADRERAAAVEADAELRDTLVGVAPHSHLELLETKRAKTLATRRRDTFGL